MRNPGPMTPAELAELTALSRQVRRRIVRLATGGGCFLGASLSCVDILVYLYSRFLRFSSPADPERDLLLLSKGHDVPALYATLVELGHLGEERLGKHLSTSDSIYWHPNRTVPGVEFHSGSLGHLLSVGAGMALDARWRGEDRRVVVVAGDGELDEGSMWEGLLVASSLGLDNLVLAVDRNGLQANGRTEDILPLEPLEAKFEAFGCPVVRVSGHDFEALEGAFSAIPLAGSRPSVVVAETVRGKGLPSIEGRVDRWFCDFTPEEVDLLLRELDGQGSADLHSPTLAVR